ncbi:hypothetical protein [Tenacibaculum retecalamus]|uniref:hypothetical protein n=1 Tax=Tenacibaculum retecalamus TaxID=3018315 RepID=UPI0023D96899|nr:hypothetical protein [Tenacibaculum retecalamus]WBX70344.1 hypothetical protein PG912_08640 [Tenacibaculum retecalamus]
MNKLFPLPAFSIAGIIMTFISIMITIPEFENKEILENGKTVNVLIEKIPDYCEKKSTRDILVVFFKFKSKTYTRNVSEKWCEKIRIGEIIQMKSNMDESEFIFTWESEKKQNSEIGSGIILSIFGLFLIFKGYYDREKNTSE